MVPRRELVELVLENCTKNDAELGIVSSHPQCVVIMVCNPPESDELDRSQLSVDVHRSA